LLLAAVQTESGELAEAPLKPVAGSRFRAEMRVAGESFRAATVGERHREPAAMIEG
jgi:hypothetical protein